MDLQRPKVMCLWLWKTNDNYKSAQSEYPAVTISVEKSGSGCNENFGENSKKVEHLKTTIIPNDVHVEITRNYGAADKVGELLLHLGIAILAVTFLVMLAMGWRGGLVVFFSVPLTFALTLFSYYMLDYTLNRITLFALVFVVGLSSMIVSSSRRTCTDISR
jgi:multidrug efflux pump subunit AcrB